MDQVSLFFKCVGCSEYVLSGNYQCHDGHNICRGCFGNLSNCPICQQILKFSNRSPPLLFRENESLLNTSNIFDTLLPSLMRLAPPLHPCSAEEIIYFRTKNLSESQQDVPSKSDLTSLLVDIKSNQIQLESESSVSQPKISKNNTSSVTNCIDPASETSVPRIGNNATTSSNSSSSSITRQANKDNTTETITTTSSATTTTENKDTNNDIDKVPNEEAKALMQKALTTPLTLVETPVILSLLKESIDTASDLGLKPEKLPLIVEHNPLVAIEALLSLMHSDHISDYLCMLLKMNMSVHSMEVVNRLSTSVELPPEFVRLYVLNCIHTCETEKDRYIQSRFVRLVCVFLQSLLRHKVINIQDVFLEIQSFCIEFSRIREAAALFRLFKQMDNNE